IVGAVVEDGSLSTSGTVSVSDVDTGEGSFVSTSSLAGTYGDFSFNLGTGEWDYSLNNASAAVQNLPAGVDVTDILTVTTDDGTTEQIAVTVTGTNDAAVITGDIVGAVVEDGSLSTSGTVSVSDVDTGEGSFVSTSSLAGTYGDFSFNLGTGEWDYSLNNASAAVQNLPASVDVTDILTVTT